MGSLRRHRQTWEGIAQGAGWTQHTPLVWPGLNEYDSEALLAALPVTPGQTDPGSPEGYKRHFRLLRDALTIWMASTISPHGMPSYTDFVARATAALAHIRQQTRLPIASLETLASRREFRPFFENGSMDVAIIDVPYNGILESMKIAAMADAYETNVAPHNFYSPLATTISAHFAASVPNLRIMEIDPDVVPWYYDLVTVAPKIENGHISVPSGPGWGTEVNEEAVRAHPAR